MEDLANALAYEIKQEIANRYFGFRKRIETESSQYFEELQKGDSTSLSKIQIDLQRIQCLLVREEVFRSFIVYTGLPGEFTYNRIDPASSSGWQMLFTDLKGEGFTRRRRHRNLVFKVYLSLSSNIDKYLELFHRLKDEHEYICQEINLFYRKNDLTTILNLLRKIDNPDSGRYEMLQTTVSSQIGRGLEHDLRIIPPPPVTSHMISFTPMPPIKTAKIELAEIISQAFTLCKKYKIKHLPF